MANDVEAKYDELASKYQCSGTECKSHAVRTMAESRINIRAALREMHSWDEEQHRAEVERLKRLVGDAIGPLAAAEVFRGMAEAERQRDELREALRKIAAMKPKRRPEWHEDTGQNVDDAEYNGYDIAAWDAATIAEAALTPQPAGEGC